MARMLYFVLLWTLFVSTSGCTEEDRENLLTRVGVMGASASAGAGSFLRLADFIDGAILPPHEIIDASILTFSFSPAYCARKTVEDLKKQDATMVIGVDYFFWFTYGFLKLEQRKKFLEIGCSYLEELECPLLLGDIPHMKGAGGSIMALMIPSPSEIEALNTQLRSWADRRSNVFIMPLSKWIAALNEGKPLSINEEETIFHKDDLFLGDHLHPNWKGMALLAIKCLEELHKHYPIIGKENLRLDMKRLIKAMKAQGAKKPR